METIMSNTDWIKDASEEHPIPCWVWDDHILEKTIALVISYNPYKKGYETDMFRYQHAEPIKPSDCYKPKQ